MLDTKFAPAERATPEALASQAKIAKGFQILQEALATIPDLLLVLNEQRQVVFANRATLDYLHRTEDEVIGLRPGELVGCIHARETPGGCGTTESCRLCGLTGAVLEALEGEESTREGRLTLESGEALDLRIAARGIDVGDERLTVVSLEDIADEKRRRALERVFFHDVLNTAGGVHGLADLLAEVSDDQREALLGMLRDSTTQLLSEIQAQRLLSAVENHDYVVTLSERSIARVLKEVAGTYTPHARLRTVRLTVDPGEHQAVLNTDHTMLGRVLGNLIKNGIEASREGMTVRIGAELGDGGVRFWVHNETALPRAAELQMFQRSFSTKGEGRGLGTYSVKLFTERYLGGRVSFTTAREGGTTFFVTLPFVAEAPAGT